MSAINMFFRVFSKDDSIMHKQFKNCRICTEFWGGFKNCWIKSTVFLFSKINICFCSFVSTSNSVRLTNWFLYFVKLTILFVPLDLRIDQNHFVFNNHDYNDGILIFRCYMNWWNGWNTVRKWNILQFQLQSECSMQLQKRNMTIMKLMRLIIASSLFMHTL